jgi:hypothetical protein
MYYLKLIFFLSIVFCLGLVTVTYDQLKSVHASILSNNTHEIQSNFTEYSDTRLGVSFEYPSGWQLNDNINRFAKNSDVTVYNNSNSFRVMKSQSTSDAILVEKLGGPREIVDIILPPEERVVGQIEENKYMIDGIDAVSVLTALEGIENIPDKGFERFLLMHEGILYIFTYQDTIEKFDTKESQDTLKHIINTIRFLNPDQNGDNENENQNETAEDDENN